MTAAQFPHNLAQCVDSPTSRAAKAVIAKENMSVNARNLIKQEANDF